MAEQTRPRRGRPPQRRNAPADPARRAAYDLLRAVADDDAYANLVLPKLLAERGLTGRDAALATELGYGTLRALGTLDLVLARCVDRDLSAVQPSVLDLLRLGTYQVLRTRIPAHAAVSTTVDLAPVTGNGRAGGFINAVLRKVTRHDWTDWVERLSEGLHPVAALAVRTAHPEWIARVFSDALGDDAAAALEADDARPVTHLVAWPGRSTRDELLNEAAESIAGPYSPYAVRLEGGGDPGSLLAVRTKRAGVQDEGSQLCALALANAPVESGTDERWLDACAGPGGKAALLAALAAGRGATLVANEQREHRAELVRAVAPEIEVLVGDARDLPDRFGATFDRVLVDAPCTGLGALRRRPEARWRRSPSDVPELQRLQRELLDAALRLTRPGGVVAFVTCSPHPTETVEVVAGRDLIDARPYFAGVPDLGEGPTVQLWPHRHGTDAMFCALIRA